MFNFFRLLSSPGQALHSLLSPDEHGHGGNEGRQDIMENVVHTGRLPHSLKKPAKTVQDAGIVFVKSVCNENRQRMRSA